MNVQVLSICLVLSRHGCDVAFLDLELPSSVFPFNEQPSVKLNIAKGMGESYLSTNFPGVSVTVVRDE